jgi:hypothetical protein
MEDNKERDFAILLLIIIFSLFMLSSCKSTKPDCDSYGYITGKDTVTIVTEHINYDDKCSESATIKNVITDTIYFRKHDVQFN